VKKNTIKKNPPERRVRKEKSQQEPRSREITVDDVIRDLLILFKLLNLDSSHLIKRVQDIDPLTVNPIKPLPRASVIGELLSLWHQDPQYLDQLGNPVPIRMEGSAPSFRALAKKAVPNVNAKQLLFELDQLGVLAIDGHGLIRARTRALPVYRDRELATTHTLNALRGFIKTLSHNLLRSPSNSDQMFHRIAWNGDLNKQDLSRLKIWMERHGQDFLESADNWMINNSKAKRGGVKISRRANQVSVGIYMTVEEP